MKNKIVLSLETNKDARALNKILNILFFYALHQKDGHCIFDYIAENGYEEVLKEYFKSLKLSKIEYLLYDAIEENYAAFAKVLIDTLYEENASPVLYKAYKMASKLKQRNMVVLLQEKIIVS